MEHSKGPWEVELMPRGFIVTGPIRVQDGLFGKEARHPLIATPNVSYGKLKADMDEAEIQANGLLIAAAPDLLEACEGLLRLCQCLALLYYHEESNGLEIRKAEKAIAKAKGEK